MPGIYGGTVGDLTIAPAGGKHVSSERERSSQSCYPPADAPGRVGSASPLFF